MVAQLNRHYLTLSPSKSVARLLTYALFEGRPLTTRGRWINPIVFRIGRSLMRSPASCDVKSPIYIMGQGRSGTTILGVVLSLHPQIGFLNEPKALWHNAYPFEDLVGNYTNGHVRYTLDSADVTPEIEERFMRLYSGYLRFTRTSRILDKYPELLHRASFIHRIFPDARFIILVRNGLEVCRSIAEWSTVHGEFTISQEIDWWGRGDRKWNCLIDDLVSVEPDLMNQRDALRPITRQQDRAALEWILTMRKTQRVAMRFPEQTLIVRYERFVQDPISSVLDILRFCDLSIDDRVLRFAAENVQRPRTAGTVSLHKVLQEPFDALMHEYSYV